MPTTTNWTLHFLVVAEVPCRLEPVQHATGCRSGQHGVQPRLDTVWVHGLELRVVSDRFWHWIFWFNHYYFFFWLRPPTGPAATVLIGPDYFWSTTIKQTKAFWSIRDKSIETKGIFAFKLFEDSQQPSKCFIEHRSGVTSDLVLKEPPGYITFSRNLGLQLGIWTFQEAPGFISAGKGV